MIYMDRNMDMYSITEQDSRCQILKECTQPLRQPISSCFESLFFMGLNPENLLMSSLAHVYSFEKYQRVWFCKFAKTFNCRRALIKKTGFCEPTEEIST